MNIIYMGTPDFSVGALRAIVKAGHNVKLVVTQPDKARGRGGEVSFSPVKQCALELGLEVYQPDKIREPEAVKKLKSIDADIYVVAAFGQILTEEVLNIPKYGCINIHASLLPKYRGAAPIQWAILNGDEKTGITIMQMDKGIDTGDILLQKSVDIDKKETGASLFDKLASLGSEAITEALELIEKGGITVTPQDESMASHVGMLNKDMGRISWNRDAAVIERYIRGLNAWPGTFTYHKGKMIKIWDVDVCDSALFAHVYKKGDFKPGEVLKADKNGIYVAAGDTALLIKNLQPEGKKRMDAAAFLLGHPITTGEIFG